MHTRWLALVLLSACGPYNDARWCVHHPDDCISSSDKAADTDVAASDDLPAAAKKIVQTNCYPCHGQGGTANGGFNYSLVVSQLIESTKVVPSDSAGSLLYQRAKEGSMPPTANKLSAADVDVLRRWIDADAKDWDPDFCAARVPMTSESELTYMVDAANALPAADRRYARFFVLSYLWNDCVPDDELDTIRYGLSKAVNSVSTGPVVVAPVAIDPDRLIYRIDLRDYGWETLNLNGVDAWEQALKEIPVVQTRPGGGALRTLVHSRLPYVPADWFVRHATQPPLYNAILRLPPTGPEFLNGNAEFMGFGVDRIAVLHAHAGDPSHVQTMRAGFVQSGVSVSNRMVERYAANTRPGAFCWESYDMASEAGKANLLANPLTPDDGIELFRSEPDCQLAPQFAFQHNGGEVICTLPNGLSAYYLENNLGTQLDTGPLTIVRDLTGPTAPVVTNGASCMFCHARGIIDKADETGAHWATHRTEPQYASLFPACIADFVAKLYPGQPVLDQMAADRAVYLAALAQTGVPAAQETEPVFVLSRAYDDDMKLERVAAELGMRTSHEGALADVAQCTTEMLAIDPSVSFALTPLLSGETISREAFIRVAAAVICGCSVVPHDDNQCLAFAATARPKPPPRSWIVPPGPCGTGTDDTDCDGLSNEEEAQYGTDPDVADTDQDGLTDEEEVHVWRTNPLEPDTDGDGLTDGREVDLALNPLAADTDGDGLSDGAELERSGATGRITTSPWNPDTDGGGVNDGDEEKAGTDQTDPRDDHGASWSDISCGPAGIACLAGQSCILADRDPYDTVDDVGACGETGP